MKIHWKKILIGLAALVVVLIAGSYLFVRLYDFDRLKPKIARAVYEATGRELRIEGHIDIKPSLNPTLLAEDVHFQNAHWGSRPDLATVKRIEIQMALFPILRGAFDLIRLRLVEPDIILEKNDTGRTNFQFDGKGGGEAPWPILIFRDAIVENGVFTYRDADADRIIEVALDRLGAVIPGLNRSIELDVKGRFLEAPFSIKGMTGPIIAWAREGYPFPVNLEVKYGESQAVIQGEIRNPTQFRDLSLTVSAEGPSLGEVVKRVGFSDVPNPGAFRVQARIEDPEETLAIRDLDIQIGSRDLAELLIQGEIKDLIGRGGIRLIFQAQGEDAARLTKLGLPPPPRRGPFRISGRITGGEADAYRLEDLRMTLSENEINGQVSLDLAEGSLHLTGRLHSNQFELGPFDTTFAITGPVDKLAVESVHLELGTQQTAKITLSGTIQDLNRLQGVDLNCKVSGEDLGNLIEIIGKPLPLRGPFKASGKLSIPEHRHYQISHLKGAVGKMQFEGSLDLDLTTDKRRYNVAFFCREIDPKELLVAELATKDLTRLLENMDPIRVNIELSGYTGELAIDRFDLTAGNEALAALNIEGAIQDPAHRRGINMGFSIQGRNVANLQQLVGRPVPPLGRYKLSGHLKDSGEKQIEVSDLMMALGSNVLTGRANVRLEEGPSQVSAELSSPAMDLRFLADLRPELFSGLKRMRNAGPVKMQGTLIRRNDLFSLQGLNVTAGKPDILQMDIKGVIGDLAGQKGLDLLFLAKGTDASNLGQVTGIKMPLQGAFALSGRLTDPDTRNYRLNDLKIAHGHTTLDGWMMLDLSEADPRLIADLSSPNLNLVGVNIPQLNGFPQKNNLGPFKIRATLLKSKERLDLQDLHLRVGRKTFAQVLIQGAVAGLPHKPTVKLDFDIQGDNLAKLDVLGLPVSRFDESFAAVGRLTNRGARTFKVLPVSVRLGENAVKGWVEADLSGERPFLRGDLSGDQIDIRPIWTKLGGKRAGEGVSSREKVPRKRVFSEEPWDLSALETLNLDVAFRNRQLLLPRWALDNLTLRLVVKDGVLTLKPLATRVGGGSAEGWVELDSRKRTTALSVDLEVTELDIGTMLENLGYEVTADGILTGAASITGSGSSPAEFMAQLNGDIQLSMGEGKLTSRYLTLLQRYLGTGILDLLNPFKSQAAYEEVNCLLLGIDVKDGLAHCKWFLDTKQTTLLSIGDIDLKTEKINFGLETKPKGQSVRFSFKGLSKPFRLGGTLVKPLLELDPKGTVFMLGQIAGAVLFGPAGIAAIFTEFNLGRENPCVVALEEAAKGFKTQKPEKEKKGWYPGSLLKKFFGK